MSPSTDPLSNPYAPPMSGPAEAEAEAPRASRRSSYEKQRTSVAVMMALSVVTLGTYPIYWYLRRASFLDARSTDKKVGGLSWVLLCVSVLSWGSTFAHAPADLARAMTFAAGVTRISVAFRVARILRADFARTGRPMGISLVAVFFFGCLYLQYVMNLAADIPARRTKRKKVASSPESP